MRAATARLNDDGFSGRSVARMPLASSGLLVCCCAGVAQAARLDGRRRCRLCAPSRSWSMRCSCNRGRIRRRSSPTSRRRSRRRLPVPLRRSDRSARPADAKVEVARPRSDMVAEIQRELLRRGFYDGAADGVYGPKTDTAIRDFEQAAGIAALGRTERHAAGIDRALGRQGAAGRDPAQRSDRGAAGAQRAHHRGAARAHRLRLRPGQAHGLYDTETRAAIERFEKARRRPVTGQVSDQLVRDLAALTGRPLE